MKESSASTLKLATVHDHPLSSNGTHSSRDRHWNSSSRIVEKRKKNSSSNFSNEEQQQLKRLLRAVQSARKGDFSARVLVGSGLVGEIGKIFNEIVEFEEKMTKEFQRVGKTVGQEGKMSERAFVSNARGGWKTKIDSVNALIGDLVQPTKEVARVITSVAKGDLSQKMSLKIGNRTVRGEFFRIGKTVNAMVDQLNSFAAEVTRVAKEVGTEGKLGGQADVKGVSGTWKDLTDNVNQLAGNLTNQVRNIAKVTTAVAKGDLSQKITVDAKGEIFELKNTINIMVDQLNSFAAEVTRVAKEVGTQGRLGGQADVKGVSGTWKDLTDNVNQLAGNLTNQVRNIAKVTTAVAKGDLSQKITVDAKGEILELKSTINIMVDQLNSFAAEVTRVAKEVGTEGKLGGQADVKGVSGTWKDLTENVNNLASNLTTQVRNIAKVTTAVAKGDLSQKITVDAKGEILELKNTINVMVDQLNSFAAEVTRVAKEVGTEGKLGGQADVKGVSGTWKDLTDNVNFMASNLTKQVRGIVKVVTAVANGDLNQKFVLEAKGEVAALAETINSMTDTLSAFADQVTTVAREVGIEGKLGGQAKVPGAAGTWKDLTNNVNQLAGNLTSQVRAIAEVSTAVTKGDLTRSIAVEAEGEVAALKNNINQMIRTLKETTAINNEQDWLKTNLAKFSGMMQGQRSLTAVAQLVMSELSPLVDARHGTFYILDQENGEPVLNLLASYAYTKQTALAKQCRMKEGVIGQCAFDKKKILISNTPNDYIKISSSLGESRPSNILVLPVLFEGQLKAVIELASFKPFSPNYLSFLDQLMDYIGVILNVISSGMRTEELLQEVKRSNQELGAQTKELEEKAKLLEVKNKEVELASLSLEEKAEQLSLISKYKSEFLANMSHELRTPLNSLLILSKILADNKDKNLTAEQVKFATTVYAAGGDLLMLINEILDLSKVEAGKMSIEPKNVNLRDVYDYIEQNFRPVAQHKGLDLQIKTDPNVPAGMYVDVNRLQQILKNLLSNALKFTEKGKVVMRVRVVESKETKHLSSILHKAERVLAFSVTDTGIGIPSEKQNLIFEAFQQADGTTSRKYGGTGLGLTISREISRLLGGHIEVESIPGAGSTFTLYMPQNYTGAETPQREKEVTVPQQPPVLPADADFKGKKILLVDDDKRNIYALTSALELRDMKVISAENGKVAIEMLSKNQDVDLVLMDTMMPEMDGVEATKAIRKIPHFSKLPILSLTAKAMQGDREKSLDAGASDYITKPVDPDILLAYMHIWLTKASKQGSK